MRAKNALALLVLAAVMMQEYSNGATSFSCSGAGPCKANIAYLMQALLEACAVTIAVFIIFVPILGSLLRAILQKWKV